MEPGRSPEVLPIKDKSPGLASPGDSRDDTQRPDAAEVLVAPHDKAIVIPERGNTEIVRPCFSPRSLTLAPETSVASDAPGAEDDVRRWLPILPAPL